MALLKTPEISNSKHILNHIIYIYFNFIEIKYLFKNIDAYSMLTNDAAKNNSCNPFRKFFHIFEIPFPSSYYTLHFSCILMHESFRPKILLLPTEQVSLPISRPLFYKIQFRKNFIKRTFLC